MVRENQDHGEPALRVPGEANGAHGSAGRVSLPALLLLLTITGLLTAGGGKTWELTVTVPAKALNGQIPRDSTVSLKIKGESGRRIRIPVIGYAYAGK